MRPKIFLLSITSHCETLIKQTDREAEETLKFKLTKPRKTFLFNPLLSIEGSRMIGLTSFEVCNSNYNVAEENNIFELYTDIYIEFSIVDLKQAGRDL